MSSKKAEYFNNPKIVVREITGRYLNASYDTSGYFTNDTTHMILSSGDEESMLILLGIINSKLIGWYFRTLFSEDSNLFPKIKINELKEIPIILLTFNQEKKWMVDKVNRMLSMNKELIDLETRFLGLLQEKYMVGDVNKRLKNWSTLNFKDFLTELLKQKIKLSLSEQSEWMQYFEGEKAKAIAIQNLIDKTDCSR